MRTGSRIHCICSGPLSSLWGVAPLSMLVVLPKTVLDCFENPLRTIVNKNKNEKNENENENENVYVYVYV